MLQHNASKRTPPENSTRGQGPGVVLECPGEPFPEPGNLDAEAFFPDAAGFGVDADPSDTGAGAIFLDAGVQSPDEVPFLIHFDLAPIDADPSDSDADVFFLDGEVTEVDADLSDVDELTFWLGVDLANLDAEAFLVDELGFTYPPLGQRDPRGFCDPVLHHLRTSHGVRRGHAKAQRRSEGGRSVVALAFGRRTPRLRRRRQI